ncbi:DNA cytosine methyltransferase, partial [Verrucomicrobia bacterium]|nr:DNA cytosine methyltransferase [Verrucomicrobiota bacterium]
MNGRRTLNFIDLFAGCGGMSLGLEMASFKPLLFSELNPSAASTYKLNRQDYGSYHLDNLSQQKEIGLCEVGDIAQLSDPSSTALEKLSEHWQRHGIREVDLVCGGPPCQGFSGIGHRRTHGYLDKDRSLIPSNHLYGDMIKVIEKVRPNIFLFENVRGIVTQKWKKGQGDSIFSHVHDDFAKISGYKIYWELVKAYEFGIPQNRPRVLLVGIKDALIKRSGLLIKNEPSSSHPTARLNGFLPKPTKGKVLSPVEILGDLLESEFPLNGEGISAVVNNTANARKYPKSPPGFTNFFREKSLKKITDHQYSNHSSRVKKRFLDMITKGVGHGTRKFSQRVLPREWNDGVPNVTITSMPDDLIHYEQPRTLTVREWARFQTFPDRYMFAGPRTTGGRRRAGNPNDG